MPLLFSYGTLALGDIQLATFGRLLRGEPDEAVGCEYERLAKYQRKEVALASGRTVWAYVYSPE